MSESDRIFTRILADLGSDRLVLPSLPDVALRVTKAIRDERRKAADVARIVQTDLSIAGRLMQVANSPLYRGVKPVSSLQAAITRLGLSVTRNLVVSFAMRQVFKGGSPVIRRRIDALWAHSTQVAAISFVLAQVALKFDPDRAMLAGLVHDIGVLPVLLYADHEPDLVAEPERLDELVGQLRGPVGARVLQSWRFDDDLIRVAVEAEEWFRNPGPEPDYCDLVLIAQIHSLFGKTGLHFAPRLEDLPAFDKFSIFTLGPDSSIELLREAREDISEMEQLLRG